MNAAPALLLALCLLSTANPGPAQSTQRISGQSLELSDKTFATVRDGILPTGGESTWRKIGWLPDLRSALKEANTLDKPVLLWAMNGHPLGCV